MIKNRIIESKQHTEWREYHPDCVVTSNNELIIERIRGINPYEGSFLFTVRYTNRHDRKLVSVDCSNVHLKFWVQGKDIHKESPYQFSGSRDVTSFLLGTAGEEKSKEVEYKALRYFQSCPALHQKAICEICDIGKASIGGAKGWILKIPKFEVAMKEDKDI